MYAILQQSGHQYRVSPGDRLLVDRLAAEVGSMVALEPVVLVQNDAGTQVGTPVVDGARVAAVVVSHRKGAKVRVFKYKPKKRYRRTHGHRSLLTELRVEALLAAGEALPEAPVVETKPAPAPPTKAARGKKAAAAAAEPSAEAAADEAPSATAEKAPRATRGRASAKSAASAAAEAEAGTAETAEPTAAATEPAAEAAETTADTPEAPAAKRSTRARSKKAESTESDTAGAEGGEAETEA
jgi:large subunit ribosomal protein L21